MADKSKTWLNLRKSKETSPFESRTNHLQQTAEKMTHIDKNQGFENELKTILSAGDGGKEPIPTKTPQLSTQLDLEKLEKVAKKKKHTAWLELLVRFFAGATALFLLLRFAVNIAAR